MDAQISNIPTYFNLLVWKDRPELTNRHLESHLQATADDNHVLFQMGVLKGHPYTWDIIYKLDPLGPRGEMQEVWGNGLDILGRNGEDCDGLAALMCGFWRFNGRDAKVLIYDSSEEKRTKHAVVFVPGPPPAYKEGPLGLAVRSLSYNGTWTDQASGATLPKLDVLTRCGFVEDPARALGMLDVQRGVDAHVPIDQIYADLLARIRAIPETRRMR